jgi:hypothetical protein
MRSIFKEFNRGDAIKAQEERVKARELVLDQRRLAENSAIIQAYGEGCVYCIDGAKSDRTAEQIDICREKLAYLPLYMDIQNQRPSWCPGFACNGTGLAAGPLSLEGDETEQQELPL